MRLSDRIRSPLPRGRDRPDAEAFFDWITLYLCFLPCSVVPIPHRVYISTCSHEVSVPQQAGAGHNKSLWSFVPHCSAWCARCDALDVINPEVTAHLASRARSSSQYGALPFLGIHAESMHTAREHETREGGQANGATSALQSRGFVYFPTHFKVHKHSSHKQMLSFVQTTTRRRPRPLSVSHARATSPL